MRTHASLARALLHEAISTFRVLPDAGRTVPLTAIDAFLASPAPSTFLAATRALSTARRAHRVDIIATRGAADAFARGLEALRALPGLDPGVIDRLATLPIDPRTAMRLSALAELMGVREELGSRAAAASAELRERLGPLPPPVAPRAPERQAKTAGKLRARS